MSLPCSTFSLMKGNSSSAGRTTDHLRLDDVACAVEQAGDDRPAVVPTSARAVTLGLVHELHVAPDVGFIRLGAPLHLHERTGVHRGADAMEHEPRAFLRDAERPRDLVGAEPFLQLAIIQTATSHLSRGSGESSKIVPTFTEN
jgi:hypothetical protein